jgi:hypothetical protein
MQYKQYRSIPAGGTNPVAAVQPAIDAALPANPPITILDEFFRFNQTV